MEGYYYKPRVDMELLEEFHEGIIALSACLAGEVQKNLHRGMYEEAKAAAFRYEKIFGKGNFFWNFRIMVCRNRRMLISSFASVAGHRN